MTDENKDQASRIKVDDLPAAEKELTAEEAKNVKGGVAKVGLGVASQIKAGDGSVKTQDVISPRDPASGLATG